MGKKIQIIKWHIGVQQYKLCPHVLSLPMHAALHNPGLGYTNVPHAVCAPAPPDVTEKCSRDCSRFKLVTANLRWVPGLPIN